jgi:16S rRNA (cytidine1402-2'-O)-methyltransferase
VVAGTGIGQVRDAPARLADALAMTAVVAAEDTQRARRLARDLGVRITGRLVSYWDPVEQQRIPDLLAELAAGRDVLLVTDAGMPGVSDPGYRLVAAAVAAGVPVSVLPGPSAVTAALAVSGLPSDRFCFEGFLPRKTGARDRRLAELAAEPRTMIFFESPRRIGGTLRAMAAALGGDRPAVLCRGLTKTHDEIRRGGLGDLAGAAFAAGQDGQMKGEITLVVGGAPEPGPDGTAEEAAAEVAGRVRAGARRADAIRAVAAERGLRRSDLYNAVVRPEPPRA